MNALRLRTLHTSHNATVIRHLTPRASVHRSHWHRRYHENAHPSQRVRIQRPLLSSRRVVSWLLYPIATVVFLQFVFAKLDEIPDEEDDVDDADHEAGSEEVEVDEEGNIIRPGDGDSLFIPMQFPQKLPHSYYKGSDPEWQEFVKFNQDQTRARAIRVELAGMIAKELSLIPQVRARLGKGISTRKYWLDIHYPDAPPPEYERSGLEFNDDYIAWSTQVIPQSHYEQMRKFLWPKAVFGATVKSAKLLYYLQRVKIKSMLGMKLTQWDQQVAQLSIAAENSRKGPTSRSGKSSAADVPDQPSDIAAPSPPSDESKRSESTGKFWIPGKPSMPTMPNDILIASAIFMNTLNQLWRSANVTALPRGCFFVVGMLELSGSQGRCLIDVQAAYDPKTAKYVAISATARHFWLHKQSPKGGP